MPRTRSKLQLPDDTTLEASSSQRKPESSRPTRKGKAPHGALGEKLRLKQRNIPSSLPPSSPPPESSARPHPYDALVISSPAPRTEYDIENDPNLPFDIEVYRDPDAPVHEPLLDVSDTNSDPFGFFAVERKLQSQRQAQPKRQPLQPLYQRDPTPNFQPLTPHKPKPKPGSRKRTAAQSDSVCDADFSPSPVKVARLSTESRSKSTSPCGDSSEKEVEYHLDERSESVSPPTPPRRTRGQRKAVDTTDPVKLAHALEARLPKRPNRKAAAAKSKATNKGTDKGAPQRPKRRPRAAKKVAPREEEEDIDDNANDEERRTRVEYFKKLKNYSMEQENVYVV